MFKDKIKKIVTGVIVIALSTAVFAGCGSNNSEFQEAVDKINQGKATLLESSSLNLSRNIIQETDEAKGKNLNNVVINNTTKDWYMESFNMDGLKPQILGETLVLNGRIYAKGREDNLWRENIQMKLQSIPGVSDLSNIELVEKDCKNIKITSMDDKESYTIIMTEDYLKRFKEKSIRSMEKMRKEYKESENYNEGINASTEMSLELMKKTNYISAECTFTLDKAGVLVGLKTSYVFETPKIQWGSDGKIQLQEDKLTVANTTDIVINSYDDIKNVEFLDSVKSELNK